MPSTPPETTDRLVRGSGPPPGFGVGIDVRERSIPIRPGDLVRTLLADSALTPADRVRLGQLARLLGSVFHYEYFAWLNELKELYAPLDPDDDCVDLEVGSAPLTADLDERFLQSMEATLIRANYRPLHLEVIRKAIEAPNELGLNYVPDFDQFEHLKVYVRGNTRVTRVVRNLRTGFRRREVVHDGYQRLFVALKFRPDAKLDQYARPDVLYLRLFKDVPHVDMEMHLPEQGTKVKMRAIDKAQIASPLMAAPATIAMKVLAATWFSLTMPSIALGSLMAAPVTAGVNSFFGFQRAKQKHLHYMIRHLYYLTLANNSSVITRLIDSAEEEEFKEALLAYFVLWRGLDDPDPWDEARLDAACEAVIRSQTGLDIDFEVGDALHKLRRLGLVHADPAGHLAAVPIDRALQILDHQWDDYFRHHNPADERDA